MRIGLIVACSAALVAGVAVASIPRVRDDSARPRAIPSAVGAEQECSHFETLSHFGKIANGNLIEASGLAASVRNPEVLWSHNDSGATAQLFALSPKGSALAQYAIDGATAVDWEDLAIGPGPKQGKAYLYLGDIGDNHHVRSSLTIYRLEEPQLPPHPTALVQPLRGATRIELTYADGVSHDAEALLVDPKTAEIFLITKSLTDTPRVFQAKLAGSEQRGTLEQVAAVRALARHSPLTSLVTAADISRDGRAIVVRTYYRAFMFACAPNQGVAQCLETLPCEVPLKFERQGESIAFATDGSGYYTTSEGRFAAIHFFRRIPP